MPRKLLIRSNVHPYHVTARANNKENFYCDLSICWEIFNENLQTIHDRHGVKVHAFVLMSNHFHLLISTPKEDIGEVMMNFIRSVTRTLNSKSRRSGRVFGAPYHWSIIHSDVYYDCALKYVYRNPVKAKISEKVEEYAFSSLNSALGISKLPYPIEKVSWLESVIPNNDPEEFLKWLNQPFHNEADAAIKQALRKHEFFPPKPTWKKTPFDLKPSCFSSLPHQKDADTAPIPPLREQPSEQHCLAKTLY